MRSPGKSDSRPPGFTLIELVLVLTIIAIVIGASIPSFTGLQDEQAAREPIRELLALAKDTRLHAHQENRPYQIVLDAEGAYAARYSSPYDGRGVFKENFGIASQRAEEKLELIMEGKEEIVAAGSVIQPEPWVDQPSWLGTYTFPDDVSCSVKSWGEGAFEPLVGETMRRWVFQPSGLCDPLTVRMERNGSYFEVTFDPLTADIAKEESYVE